MDTAVRCVEATQNRRCLHRGRYGPKGPKYPSSDSSTQQHTTNNHKDKASVNMCARILTQPSPGLKTRGKHSASKTEKHTGCKSTTPKQQRGLSSVPTVPNIRWSPLAKHLCTKACEDSQGPSLRGQSPHCLRRR